MSLRTLARGNSVVEFVLIVLIALGLAFAIQAVIVKPYRIPSPSMEPTLDVGQRVLVNRIGNSFSDPHVGEIVVFHPPQGAVGAAAQCGAERPAGAACSRPSGSEATVNFIKRVVAGPGDRVQIVDGHVIRNGKREADGYTQPCQSGDPNCNFASPITIPAGYWFMMGDNRGASDDSRFWGPVPKSWIIGGAFATYWPPDRVGFL